LYNDKINDSLIISNSISGALTPIINSLVIDSNNNIGYNTVPHSIYKHYFNDTVLFDSDLSLKTNQTINIFEVNKPLSISTHNFISTGILTSNIINSSGVISQIVDNDNVFKIDMQNGLVEFKNDINDTIVYNNYNNKSSTNGTIVYSRNLYNENEKVFSEHIIQDDNTVKGSIWSINIHNNETSAFQEIIKADNHYFYVKKYINLVAPGIALNSILPSSDGQLLITNSSGSLAYNNITSTCESIFIENTANNINLQVANTGFVNWDSGSVFYDDSVLGEFTLILGGVGMILGENITWLPNQTVTGLLEGVCYYIFIDSSGILNKTTSPIDLFKNNIVLFECFRDSSSPTNNQITVKENHNANVNYNVSKILHDTIGIVIHGSGANIALNGTLKVQINGSAILEDHGLETTIPDSLGAGVFFNLVYLNSSNKWVTYKYTDTFEDVYNNAGVITTLPLQKYVIYTLYVSKDDLNSTNPRYFAIIDSQFYISLVQCQNAVTEGLNQQQTENLSVLELAQLGHIVFKDDIEYVNIAKSTTNASISQSGPVSNLASGISTDTTNFDTILSASDTNVQLALNTINYHDTHEMLHNNNITSLTTQNVDDTFYKNIKMTDSTDPFTYTYHKLLSTAFEVVIFWDSSNPSIFLPLKFEDDTLVSDINDMYNGYTITINEKTFVINDYQYAFVPNNYITYVFILDDDVIPEANVKTNDIFNLSSGYKNMMTNNNENIEMIKYNQETETYANLKLNDITRSYDNIYWFVYQQGSYGNTETITQINAIYNNPFDCWDTTDNKFHVKVKGIYMICFNVNVTCTSTTGNQRVRFYHYNGTSTINICDYFFDEESTKQQNKSASFCLVCNVGDTIYITGYKSNYIGNNYSKTHITRLL
ncbi:MAG: hypothetical protein GQ557_01640, partial [Mycoplasmataceae bacterium]|nr:hypothetical protein [Mycoplasmataceae bacterium]